MKQTRWAIAGTGYIANEFAKGLAEVTDGIMAAVSSRSLDSGKAYAGKYGCEKIYTDYQQMLDQEQPDAVYIATPNDCHYDYIMAALERSIPVLCEKPMVDNSRQLEAVLAKAREKNTFLMEGMWTRCFPAVIQARQWISEGRIGRPLAVRSAFDIKPGVDEWQAWKGGLEHAGGALRDVGIYSLAMAEMVFPEMPQNVSATRKSNGEVDESFHMLIEFSEGRAAFVSGAFNQISSPVTEIVGESGRIQIGPEFYHPTTATLINNDKTAEQFHHEYPATGFQFEIREVQECLSQGVLESSKFTLAETRKIAELIEKTRKEWGIFYNSDEE